MVNLVTRKNADKLREYFEDDFGTDNIQPPLWKGVTENIRTKLFPASTWLMYRHKRLHEWKTLNKESFLGQVNYLERTLRKGGILTCEFVFSPPKSVSVAALAGPEIDEGIIVAHHGAVDDTMLFLAPSLLERRAGKLVGTKAVLTQFTHPWNRSEEPQLHSHVLLSRFPGRKTWALYTYPYFLHQDALRAVYHYSLASRLCRKGYAIRIDKPGSWGWELEGISPKILKSFAERSEAMKEQARIQQRGYFSMAVETRLVGLASRRQLPKSNPTFSLMSARESWSKTGKPTCCVPVKDRSESSPSKTLIPPATEQIFRRHSILSNLQFAAIHLANWLGSAVSLSEALKTVDRRRFQLFKDGELVADERGRGGHKAFRRKIGKQP